VTLFSLGTKKYYPPERDLLVRKRMENELFKKTKESGGGGGSYRLSYPAPAVALCIVVVWQRLLVPNQGTP